MDYDIKDVCRKMQLSSRTLRYYEEEGLISSVRKNENTSRHYTEEQVEKIRKIKILRSLSFTIKDIKEIFGSGKDIMKAVEEKTNIIAAEVLKREKELRYIQTALTKIHEGKNIFEVSFFENTKLQEKQKLTAKKVIDLFEEGNVQHLKDYFAKHLRKYVDADMFLSLWKERTAEFGGFKGIKEIQSVEDDLFVTMEMNNMDIIYTFHFFDEYLCGIVFGSVGYYFGGIKYEDEK